jgi:alanine racemase
MTVPPEVHTWAEIDLTAIRHNVDVVRQRIGPAAGIVAVVKANAYGHGARPVVEALAGDVDFFGVANLGEAREIADLGRDILLLSPALPAERREVVACGFIATVSSVAEAAEFRGGRVNLKIDTGMGRIGCWQEEALKTVAILAQMPEVVLHSISTHLPSADEDAAFTREQLETFAALSAEFRRLAPGARIHALASGGILEFPTHAHDLVRPGLMLYGSAYPAQHQALLRPALTWKTRVLLVRDVGPGRSVSYGRTYFTNRPSRIAALGVGYADGYPRQASNRGAQVLINGRRCPVVGRVTMDQILVDVTGMENVHPGSEAVLIGRQGLEEILARDLADQAETIAWHIFTGLGPRVKRVYL